jgi:TolB-like protein/tetratricopeptide (TPR) repeat protein
MFADIAGYTAMTQKNESTALEMLEEYRSLVRSTLTRHGGFEVKTIGDALLVEFDSALDATKCAVQIQQVFHERNSSVAPDHLLQARIGIHLGDVVHSAGDAYGDAVNIASRIEPLASPGGVCISEQVYDQVRNKAEFPITGLGKQQLKNVQLPVEVYRVVFPWESGTPMTSGRDRTRIAVLPFANISSDPKDEYFADGLTEELISNLSSVAGLRVIARTSVMRFKGSMKGVGEISNELNVGSILEGSVRKAGSRLRVTTQLIDPATEEHLWAQTYDKEMEDVFAIQTDIAQKVASSLRVKLLSSEIENMDSRATRSVEAYTLYLKGRHHWNRRSESGLTTAVTFFEQAIQEDPNYAVAYAGLADAYSLMGFYAFRSPSEVYPKARELVIKALELDESLAEAHASLGEVLMHHYWDWAGADASLTRAISLKPNYATAHLWRATYFQANGLLEEALAEDKKCLELDPLSLIGSTDLARCYYFMRAFDKSEDQYKKTLELDSTFALAHKGLAEVYALTGRHIEALEEIQKALDHSGGSLFIKDDLGFVYALTGRADKAREMVDELRAATSTRYVPPYGIAVIHFALGETEKGFDWLETAFKERSFMTFIKVDPIFDKFRKMPRFASLLENMGLAG